MSDSCNIHASAVAKDGKVVLILGESGAGKSSLLVELLAKGFTLVGDDRVVLEDRGEKIWVRAMPNAENRFEIRGIGICVAQTSTEGNLAIVVDLDHPPEARLPHTQFFNQFEKKTLKINAKGANNIAEFLYLYINERITLANLD